MTNSTAITRTSGAARGAVKSTQKMATTTAKLRTQNGVGPRIAKPVAKAVVQNRPSPAGSLSSRSSSRSPQTPPTPPPPSRQPLSTPPSRIPQPSPSRTARQSPAKPRLRKTSATPSATPSPPPAPPTASRRPSSPPRSGSSPSPPQSPVLPSRATPSIKADPDLDDLSVIAAAEEEEDDEVLVVKANGEIEMSKALPLILPAESTSGESAHSADDEGSRDGEAAKSSSAKRANGSLAARRANRTWKHFYEEVRRWEPKAQNGFTLLSHFFIFRRRRRMT